MANNKIKYVLTLVFVVIFSSACSQTVKGPVTGAKYNVNIGGWKDKGEYDKARQEALKPAESECHVVDCPEHDKEILSY